MRFGFFVLEWEHMAALTTQKVLIGKLYPIILGHLSTVQLVQLLITEMHFFVSLWYSYIFLEGIIHSPVMRS